jgi:DNA-binding transcriptional LysR family regulator
VRRPWTPSCSAPFSDIFPQDWLNRVRKGLPDLSPSVEVSTAARAAQKLARGDVHVGFLYSPPQLAGLMLREVNRVELVLVSSVSGRSVQETLCLKLRSESKQGSG